MDESILSKNSSMLCSSEKPFSIEELGDMGDAGDEMRLALDDPAADINPSGSGTGIIRYSLRNRLSFANSLLARRICSVVTPYLSARPCRVSVLHTTCLMRCSGRRCWLPVLPYRFSDRPESRMDRLSSSLHSAEEKNQFLLKLTLQDRDHKNRVNYLQTYYRNKNIL